MTAMKTIATLLLRCCSRCGAALASGGADLRLDPAPIHRLDAESLQRGARNFVNYCLNCHSAKYMRYERLTDIGLTEQQIKDNLMFGDRQDRLDHDGRHDARRGQGLVRRRAARPVGRGARARRRLALQLFPRRSIATTRRPPAGTTSCSRTSPCRTCCGRCRDQQARVDGVRQTTRRRAPPPSRSKGLVRIDPALGGKYVVRTVQRRSRMRPAR